MVKFLVVGWFVMFLVNSLYVCVSYLLGGGFCLLVIVFMEWGYGMKFNLCVDMVLKLIDVGVLEGVEFVDLWLIGWGCMILVE